MYVSNHAIARMKKRGIAPKRSSKKRVQNMIKDAIKNKCKSVYIDSSTGAKVYITEDFTVITKFGTVVTIYREEDVIAG